jgi:hypothetical protein
VGRLAQAKVPRSTWLARLRQKNLGQWLPGYLRQRWSPERSHNEPITRHLLFTLCDHYEPLWEGVSTNVGTERVRAWEEGYPKLANEFRDADGLPPRHTFFFPGEQYHPSFLDSLGRLARAGFGEVELHLHHDNDSAANLARTLSTYVSAYAWHGHLSRDGEGHPRYGFIHGNWCLANARRDGKWCGVDAELPLLFESGCYADFTFPSAPDECQPRIINQIYWPTGDLEKARAYENGIPAGVGTAKADRILMIQGPLALSRRPGGFRVRIESGAVTAKDPGTLARVRTWVEQDIHVAGRPEWTFVKVHTHGAPEGQAASLLGDGGRRLHQALTQHFNDGRRWKLHYLTAREMYNVARAAIDGRSGDPAAYRNYLLPPPPVAIA